MNVVTNPTLSDVLDLAVQTATSTQQGPVPAKVLSYDAAKQCCDAEPLVMVPRKGGMVKLEIARDVPVMWPSGAGWSLVGPMATGDIVWLIPAGADIGHWVASNAKNSPAVSYRKLDMSDVVALPGSRPFPDPLTASAYSVSAVVLAAQLLLLGNSGATDFVALASKVIAEFEAIRGFFDTHIHTTTFGNTGVPTVLIETVPITQGIAATKVKAI